MSVTKRSSKIISYNENDDDDDFISTSENSKKTRTKKLKESSTKTREKKPEPVLIETENVPNHSTVFNNHENPSQETECHSSIDDVDEPANKRMKYEMDPTDENTEESIPDISTEEVPTIPLNRLVDPPRRHSSVPIGFPTSKINIPSPHVSRVGLSRKSLPAKSLHPNLTARVVVPE